MADRDDASTVPGVSPPTSASGARDIADPDADLVAYSPAERYVPGMMLGKSRWRLAPSFSAR